MARNKIGDLRNHLFAQLEKLQDDDCNLEEEAKRAKAMAEIAHQIIESARIEVQYIKATDGEANSQFILLGTNN